MSDQSLPGQLVDPENMHVNCKSLGFWFALMNTLSCNCNSHPLVSSTTRSGYRESKCICLKWVLGGLGEIDIKMAHNLTPWDGKCDVINPTIEQAETHLSHGCALLQNANHAKSKYLQVVTENV